MAEALIEAVGPWWFLWALFVAIMGVGRWSRLVTYDKFPPVVWVREKWEVWTVKHAHSDWTDLLFCPWCFTPWLFLICIGWFALTFVAPFFAWSWWLFWGWGAVSYVASIVISYDQKE